MARWKRLEGATQRWAGDAEAVWTGMADWRAAHPKATFGEIEAALAAAAPPPPAPVVAPAPSALRPPAPPKTVVYGRPTKAHPGNRRLLPHRPASPADN